MDMIIVTGSTTGKKYAIPVSDIGLVSEHEKGSKIDLKVSTASKIKYVECTDSFEELTKFLTANK